VPILLAPRGTKVLKALSIATGLVLTVWRLLLEARDLIAGFFWCPFGDGQLWRRV